MAGHALKRKGGPHQTEETPQKIGALVDGELEGKEEEEGSVGLGDFGFALQAKKGDENNVEVEADDDDLDHIVDELSDIEGDK